MPVALSHRKKPIGILLISLYGTLVGILNVMEGVYSLRSYGLESSRSDLFFLGIFSIFFGLIFLITAVGFWAVQEWAHPLTRVVYIVAMGWTLIYLLSEGFSVGETILRTIEFSVMLAILSYLKKPEIKILYHFR